MAECSNAAMEEEKPAPRIQLPEGAIPASRAACDPDPPPAAWHEIELHTPTADHPISIRPPGFTPAPGIPENATTFATIVTSSASPNVTETAEESSPAPQPVAVTPPSSALFLVRQPTSTSEMIRELEASTCRIPLNPFDQEPPVTSHSTVTPQVTQVPEKVYSDLHCVMRTRTFSPSVVWKRSKLGSRWGPDVTSSLPPIHASTTTQTSLLEGALDPTECQLEEGVSVRDVKSGHSGNRRESILDCQDLESPATMKTGVKTALKNFVSGFHPLYIPYLCRGLFTLPLALLFLSLALTTRSWRHVELSYLVDHAVKSHTLIGLGAIERSTETQSSILPAAATVRELPLTFKQILSPNSEEKYCDPDVQTQAATAAIGDLTIGEVLSPHGNVKGPESLRARRLALYHLIHGPTFRDVDCRHIRRYRSAGIAVRILCTSVIIFMLAEWWIIGISVLTRKRFCEAKDILQWSLMERRIQKQRQHLRVETDPGLCPESLPSPPFVLPRKLNPQNTLQRTLQHTIATHSSGDKDISHTWHREPSWAMIDLKNRGASNESVPPRDRRKFNRVRQSLKKSRLRLKRKRCSRHLFCSSKHAGSNKVCLLGRRRVTHLKFTRPSDRFWWRPLTRLEQCCRCSGRGGSTSYFAVSVLGGSTLLICSLEALFLTLAAFIYVTKTTQPACLDAETHLETCRRGKGINFLFVTLGLTYAALYLHLKTPSICDRLLRISS
eukprot:Blabericola_migrator_1__3920@NODE_2186_length_3151_cov_218_761025_g1376_i0_p1_GENE_NODE_2186_length_3151_cov_218_761025_g1376_i0NODE_2186_length_3151_cov_218_761025_g1376_i0_p1_ORF_typecomplete_len726_score140_04_NODE_2186_length_3151_cov_218_761025_g1376_i09453122